MEIYKCGGQVRDELIGRELKDRDYVVVGSTPEQMLALGYKQVGAEFPVFLHPETGEEYALARTEIKTGDKHTDFKFDFGPHVTLKMDSDRRDFTMNAIYIDEGGNIIDFHDGTVDIHNKIIRHVNSKYFIQDPLRVLRACQFAARFEFTIAEETKTLCHSMVEQGMLAHLTPERIWKEIEKALQTPNFDIFIKLLDEVNALETIFPELYELKKVPERLEYHPEGNAYKHVLLAIEKVPMFNVEFILHENEITKHKLALVNFGLLCHDFGKALTEECWPSHHGHDVLGMDIVDQLCDRLKIPNEYRDFGKLACKYHMKFYEFLKSHVKSQYDMVKAISNFRDLDTLQLICKVHHCDLFGREGEITQIRIDTAQKTTERIARIFCIMKGVTVKDLPKETQENLFKFKGEKFGKLYRDAMISYLKHGLHQEIDK